jgi:hypothetical protein
MRHIERVSFLGPMLVKVLISVLEMDELPWQSLAVAFLGHG